MTVNEPVSTRLYNLWAESNFAEVGQLLPGYPDATDFSMQDFNGLPANYPDPDATDSFMQDFYDNGPDNSDPADADTSMLSAGQHATPQVKLEISAMTAIQRKTTMTILKVIQKTASQAPTQKAGQTVIVVVTPTRVATPRPIQIQTVMLPRMARRCNWTKKHTQQLQEDRKIVHPKNNTSESTNKR